MTATPEATVVTAVTVGAQSQFQSFQVEHIFCEDWRLAGLSGLSKTDFWVQGNWPYSIPIPLFVLVFSYLASYLPPFFSERAHNWPL